MSVNELLSLRRQIIEKNYSRLNKMQLEAVTTVNGPLLILAGAGSGKTTVIVNRIAGLIKYGNAYNSEKMFTGFIENPAGLFRRYLNGDASVYDTIKVSLCVDAPAPWQILAITFTNKAANELKERLVGMLGEEGNDIWASTFHSACVRMLRRDADKIGYSSHFTIYDTDDSKRVIKECQRLLGIDDKYLPHKSILNEISRAKDSLISPEDYLNGASFDQRKKEIGKVYSLYQDMLKKADAMDFDDIIVNTVNLLDTNTDVLDYYRNKFRYIMVDEYQDTNHAQYVLVSMLASGHNNICVVGDDDQSIYSFRGATIENILSFEKQFVNAKVIRLEENYRSTQNILDAANAVIANNNERKGKNLWTSNGEGDKITLHTTSDDVNEGIYVANSIMNYAADGGAFSDNAVLYRTNAQSNNIERAFVKAGVPYRIIGGHRFYDRKEIKDALAYLAVVSNKNDNIRLRRIINEPKRGIGDTTVNNISEIASRLGESMFSVMKTAQEFSVLSKSASKLRLFTEMIETFSTLGEKLSIADLFKTVMVESGYIQFLVNDEETKEERLQNLDELYSTIARYEEENGDDATLEGFLEEVALLSDIDNYNSELDTVTLMTLHSAKGLEFPNVYLVGMENGLFPSTQSIYEPVALEEERRLAYVGITRAKKRLYLLNAYSRMQYGKTTVNPPSCFLDEIPSHLIENTTPKAAPRQTSFSSAGSSYGGSYSGYSRSYSNYDDEDYTYYASSSKKADSYSQRINVGSTINKNSEAPLPDIKTGDTVLHRKFGKGMVVLASPLGNDILVEVAFESCGTKKLMAKAAKLQKA